jgi:sporulation protein YlmC with PRC-barrel domain
MKPSGDLKLLREVRDLQVIDKDGGNCGICDDVEFEGAPGGPLVIRSLLIGPAALRRRLPDWLSKMLALVFTAHIVRVPWEDVETVTSRIKLKRSASHYGLTRCDDRIAPYLKWIPSL